MKHEITLFCTMGPNRNVLLKTHLLLVTIYGPIYRALLTQDDAGPFESPLLPAPHFISSNVVLAKERL